MTAVVRPRVVIVGAGLGGCTLAHALLDTHDVTVIERGTAEPDLGFPIADIGRPAGMDAHVAAGLGGTTQLWHNGLIEIDDQIFKAHWPITKSALAQYYDEAFSLLGGGPRAPIRAATEELRAKYKALGLRAEQLPALYYPRWPVNLWQSLQLAGRIRLVRGEAVNLELGADGRIGAVEVRRGNLVERVVGDIVVLAAGGLATPLLLQRLNQDHPLPALHHAGRHYEDHPMGFVGEVQVTVPLFKLWNFYVRRTGGNLRLPFVITKGGMQVSFQLRPAANYYRDSRRERVGTVLNDLRRSPWNLVHYLKLFNHWDDILDILSFKFGIHLPTKHYTVLLMAQMPPSEDRSVWREQDAQGRGRHVRCWHLTPEYLEDLSDAVQSLFAELAPVLKSARCFSGWQDQLRTGAHHSGTARMSTSPESGVCDRDCRVHGLKNLYVCDGSVIPASGIANTGLTIGALAMRLADHLRAQAPASVSSIP